MQSKDIDYSQIESRILSHMMTKLPNYHEQQERSDVYKLLASTIFNIPYDQVSEAQRKSIKDTYFLNAYSNKGDQL